MISPLPYGGLQILVYHLPLLWALLLAPASTLKSIRIAGDWGGLQVQAPAHGFVSGLCKGSVGLNSAPSFSGGVESISGLISSLFPQYLEPTLCLGQTAGSFSLPAKANSLSCALAPFVLC